MDFELWHIWLLIALILFIMEIFVPSFILFNFGIGALVGSLAAGVNLPLEWQIVFFSFGTLLSFFLVRPVMKKYAYKRTAGFRSNADAMVGRQAIVTDPINNVENRGLVSLDGDTWKARSVDNDEIPKGSVVEIIQLNSIILTVKKVN